MISRQVLGGGSERKGYLFMGLFLKVNQFMLQSLDKRGIILLGNESKGISDDLMPFITEKLMIPRFNDSNYGIDSLNVRMAACGYLFGICQKTKL